MIGAIIGDIAGSCYEFNNTSDYNFPMFSREKDFTDDTICTVAVADAILKDIDFQTSLKRWCRKFPHPMGEYGGYFYKWIMSDDARPYGSYGNGSAMRVSHHRPLRTANATGAIIQITARKPITG